MQTHLPYSVHARINAFMAMTLHEAADTDLDGILATLEPAMDALFAHTPAEAHGVLADALVQVAADYDLAEEVADIAEHCQRQAAGLPDPDDEGGSC